MPALGDIVKVNMCNLNGNEPCAAIVTKANDDGSITCTVFPANGEAPATLTGVPHRDTVDETFVSYGDPTTSGTTAAPGSTTGTSTPIP